VTVDCRGFEAKIDQYLDAVLSRSDMKTAADHVQGCKECNALVMSYQHASVLLRTAVADKAAAVDVSGLWKSIEASLDADPGSLARPESSDARDGFAATTRGARRVDFGRRVRDLVVAILGPAPLRAGAFAAAAAGLALFVLAGGTDIGTKIGGQIAEKKTEAPTVISQRDDRPRAKHVRFGIDNVDIPSGNSVSIWSRPRTRTQVIWVDGPDEGFGVSNLAATATSTDSPR